MAHVSDFTQTNDKILLDLINEQNNTSLTLDDVSVALKSIQDPVVKNTVAILTGKPGSGYTDTQRIEYNRLNIQNFVDLYYPTGLVVPQGDGVNISDFIPELEAGLGIRLTAGVDYQDKPIGAWNDVPNEVKQVLIQIISASKVYTGSMILNIDGNDIPLSNVITKLILKGLNLPTTIEPSEYTEYRLTTGTGNVRVTFNKPWQYSLNGGSFVSVNANQQVSIPRTTSILRLKNILPGEIVSGGGGTINDLQIIELVKFQTDNHPIINFYKNRQFVKVPDLLPPNVTDLSYMFLDAQFFNQDISGWDTKNVTSIKQAFFFALRFNQNLSGWNMSGVTNPLNRESYDGNTGSWQASNKPKFPN